MPMKRNPKTNKISQLKLKTDEENEAKNWWNPREPQFEENHGIDNKVNKSMHIILFMGTNVSRSKIIKVILRG
jgi:hypothetical protein